MSEDKNNSQNQSHGSQPQEAHSSQESRNLHETNGSKASHNLQELRDAQTSHNSQTSRSPQSQRIEVGNVIIADKKKTRKPLVIGVIAGVIVIIAVAVCVWLFGMGGNSMFDSNAREGQAPYKTEEEIIAELNRMVEEGMFNISIASEIEFENGTAPGTAYIENVPGNRYDMQVTIVDDNNPDRVFYQSGLIKPNQYIEAIQLSEDLEPGSYPATATFKAYDVNTHQEVGQAAAKVTLNVLG